MALPQRQMEQTVGTGPVKDHGPMVHLGPDQAGGNNRPPPGGPITIWSQQTKSMGTR